jgi:hypothetical protein
MLDLLLKTTTTKPVFFNGTSSSSSFDVESFLTGASAAIIVLAIFALLICLAIAALIIVSNCKIFAKAGQKWWKALIPLYNSWVETKICGLAWWWFPIFVVITALFSEPRMSNYVVSMGLVLVSFNYCYNMAIKFGKSKGFAVLLAILPVIGLPMLAFGSAKYDKDAKVDQNGIFSVK